NPKSQRWTRTDRHALIALSCKPCGRHFPDILGAAGRWCFRQSWCPFSQGVRVPKPVALVTGASTGIGFEAAKKLSSHGFIVYAGARRVDRMEPLKALGIQVLALDVTDEESM